MSKPTLPEWGEAATRVEAGEASALDKFIHDQEPAGEQGEEFRNGLADVLAERFGQAEPVAASVLCWVHEDELPESLTDEAYSALFPYSRIDGVRLFPVFAAPQPDRVAEDCEECAAKDVMTDGLIDRVAELEREVSQHKASIHGYCRDNAEASRQLRAKDSRIAELARERDDWKASAHSLNSEVTLLAQERDALAEEVERLRKAYQKLRNESAKWE